MVIRVKMKFVEFVKFVVAINKREWSFARFFICTMFTFLKTTVFTDVSRVYIT